MMENRQRPSLTSAYHESFGVGSAYAPNEELEAMAAEAEANARATLMQRNSQLVSCNPPSASDSRPAADTSVTATSANDNRRKPSRRAQNKKGGSALLSASLTLSLTKLKNSRQNIGMDWTPSLLLEEEEEEDMGNDNNVGEEKKTGGGNVKPMGKVRPKLIQSNTQKQLVGSGDNEEATEKERGATTVIQSNQRESRNGNGRLLRKEATRKQLVSPGDIDEDEDEEEDHVFDDCEETAQERSRIDEELNRKIEARRRARRLKKKAANGANGNAQGSLRNEDKDEANIRKPLAKSMTRIEEDIATAKSARCLSISDESSEGFIISDDEEVTRQEARFGKLKIDERGGKGGKGMVMDYKIEDIDEHDPSSKQSATSEKKKYNKKGSLKHHHHHHHRGKSESFTRSLPSMDYVRNDDVEGTTAQKKSSKIQSSLEEKLKIKEKREKQRHEKEDKFTAGQVIQRSSRSNREERRMAASMPASMQSYNYNDDNKKSRSSKTTGGDRRMSSARSRNGSGNGSGNGNGSRKERQRLEGTLAFDAVAESKMRRSKSNCLEESDDSLLSRQKSSREEKDRAASLIHSMMYS